MVWKELVISHYEKSLSWLENNDKYWASIYDKGNNKKGVPLPNIGREPHTFITHIVRNYEELANTTIFLQDNPFEHGVTMQDILNAKTKNFTWLGKTNYSTDEQGRPHHAGLPIKQVCDRLGLTPKYPLRFAAGGQFVVTKERILKRPIGFYKKCMVLLETIDDAPWVFERIWRVIFDEK